MKELRIVVSIHDDGKRILHVELDGKPVDLKDVPRFLRLIAEDLETGQLLTHYYVKD